MKIIELFKKSFNVVMGNPSITLFLVLYLIFSNVLARYMSLSQNYFIAMTIAFCMFALAVCFVSGWLEIIKEGRDEKKDKKYFSIFLEGIGKNIIPISLGIFIYSILFILTLVVMSAIASKLFGNLDFVLKDMPTFMNNANAFMEYFKNLTVEQKYTIYAWQLSLILASTIYNFIFMFFFPAIICSSEKRVFVRPFVALVDSFKFLFKNFLKALGVFLFVYAIYAILNILGTVLAPYAFASILVLFIYIYFISFAIMLIFNCYAQEDSCNNGCDSIGENESDDSISKEI